MACWMIITKIDSKLVLTLPELAVSIQLKVVGIVLPTVYKDKPSAAILSRSAEHWSQDYQLYRKPHFCCTGNFLQFSHRCIGETHHTFQYGLCRTSSPSLLRRLVMISLVISGLCFRVFFRSTCHFICLFDRRILGNSMWTWNSPRSVPAILPHFRARIPCPIIRLRDAVDIIFAPTFNTLFQ